MYYYALHSNLLDATATAQSGETQMKAHVPVYHRFTLLRDAHERLPGL